MYLDIVISFPYHPYQRLMEVLLFVQITHNYIM